MNNTLKINTESTPYFGGLGDSILLAWFSEGAKNTETPIELWASGSRQLMLECLGQPIAKNTHNCITPSGAYDLELADHGKLPRVEYVRKFLNIETPLKRPQHNIPPALIEWARTQRQQHCGNSPMVLLFPQTHWKPREWHHAHWIQLGIQLKRQGLTPIFMLTHDDQKFTQSPTMAYWGFSLAHVMAMIFISDVVVGNDSAPAHLAGTLGKKTIAILGPTKPTVFGHIENVFCLQSTNQSCVGCHFAQPLFNQACDSGCSALFSVSPEQVQNRINVLLGE